MKIKKLGLILLLILNATPAAYAELPDIVIILVDDMGYGDARCYNAKSKIPTPNIDSLAEQGLLFTDAHAPGPLCHLSRYGLMTGIYPFRANTNQWRTQPSIQAGQMTIASLLNQTGYETSMIGKWHLGFDEQGYEKPMNGGPVDVGFDSFFGIRASTDIPPYYYIRDRKVVSAPTQTIPANQSEGWSPIQGAFWREGGISPNLDLKDVLPEFTKAAVEVIENHALQRRTGKSKAPLMLYLAYPAPHTPWLPSSEFIGKSEASMYGDFTNMVDANIGVVLKALKKNELSDNTLLIFTSDNGPVWYEEDVKRFQHDSSGGLRGMKADAWECGHRMPFLVRWPGTVAPGTVSHQTICFTDLLATFAELTQQQLPREAGLDSFSFLSVLLGKQPEDQPVHPHLIIASGRNGYTIREGDWKYIDMLGSGGFSKPNRIKPQPGGPKNQLYNLKTDPGETTNLTLQHPEISKQMKKTLKGIVDSGRSRPFGKSKDD
jgi:arylsulfatase A-like enzyme